MAKEFSTNIPFNFLFKKSIHVKCFENSNLFFKVHKVEGTNVIIKSSLFGTFAANSLLLPPNFIDFEDVFDNFIEKITTTPHVLIVVCCILLLSIPATVLLRRADREDHYRVCL